MPGGKMVKLDIEQERGKISEARIRGDFFIEPPEKLRELEKALEGLKPDSEVEEVEKELEDVEAKLIGFSISDIAEVFRQAVEGEEE